MMSTPEKDSIEFQDRAENRIYQKEFDKVMNMVQSSNKVVQEMIDI